MCKPRFTVYKGRDNLWYIDTTVGDDTSTWSVKSDMGAAIARAEQACDNYGLDYSHITVDLRGIS